jgi:aconitate hydratase
MPLRNLALEYVRNERYRFFKWAERAFDRLNIVPPGQGICHQINLERLTSGCIRHDGQWIAETVIGTTATPQWSMRWACWAGAWADRGGTSALARRCRSPCPAWSRCGWKAPWPRGIRPMRLFITPNCAANVVDEIVEFCGPALDHLTLTDRATIANMCPNMARRLRCFRWIGRRWTIWRRWGARWRITKPMRANRMTPVRQGSIRAV